MALYPDTEIDVSDFTSGSLSDLQTEGSGWYTGSSPGVTFHFGFADPAGDITGQQTLNIEMRSADESYSIEVSTLEIQENGSTVASFSPANVSAAETRTFTWDGSTVSDPTAIEIYGETSHTGGGQRANFDLGFVEWQEQLDQTLSVSTNQPQNVGSDSTTLEADLTYEGYGNTADVWFDFRQTIDESWSQTATQTVSSSQTVTDTVTVNEATEYEYRAQAEDSTAGVTDTGVTVTFETSQTLSGVAVDENGTALSGATVYVVDESDDSTIAELTTDGSGGFSVDVPAGTYHVGGQYDDGTQYAGPSFPGVGLELTAGSGGGSGSGANLENADIYEPFDDSSYTDTFAYEWDGGLDTYAIVDAPERAGNQFEIELRSGEHYGADFRHHHEDLTGSQHPHVYHRYLFRFDENFETSMDGKLNGFLGADDNWGLAGDPADGTSWSAQMGFASEAVSPGDPVPLEWYIYHMDVDYDATGGYGEHDPFDHQGSQYYAPTGQWLEIEQEIDLGTPGENDGIIRTWIDGTLQYERTDLHFRDSGGNDVRETILSLYHGGSDTAPSTVGTWHDDFYIHRSGVP